MASSIAAPLAAGAFVNAPIVSHGSFSGAQFRLAFWCYTNATILLAAILIICFLGPPLTMRLTPNARADLLAEIVTARGFIQTDTLGVMLIIRALVHIVWRGAIVMARGFTQNPCVVANR